MRRIPPAIASQHPDNALAPFWDTTRPFISAFREMEEAVSCFRDLGVSEYMWDWEGKHADAAVIDRLFSDYYAYFSKQQLGRDKFLTFRIPNIWEEKGYNLMQAMTVILSSEDFARDLKFAQRPLFEVILPMTERPDQLSHMQKLFQKLAHFKSKEFTSDQPANNDYLEMIPLVESVESQLKVADLLTGYVQLHTQQFAREPEYVRLFFACSDSALTSGHLASILGNKLLIARCYEFEQKSGIPVFPFAGPGSLVFRGGLSPYSVDRFLKEYTGVRTVTVQSAFRYDNPTKDVKAAIARLEAELPETPVPRISTGKQAQLEEIINQSSKLYRETLNGLAESMQPIFKAVPKRRDRRQHIGLLAYSRSLQGQNLPRAITFTAGFYSVGVPPEFIGAGRALASLDSSKLSVLQSVYPSLASDYEAAGRFLNIENLRKFASGSAAWKTVLQDVEAIQEVLKITLGPKSKDEQRHYELSAELIARPNDADLATLIEEMAALRKSLG